MNTYATYHMCRRLEKDTILHLRQYYESSCDFEIHDKLSATAMNECIIVKSKYFLSVYTDDEVFETIEASACKKSKDCEVPILYTANADDDVLIWGAGGFGLIVMTWMSGDGVEYIEGIPRSEKKFLPFSIFSMITENVMPIPFHLDLNADMNIRDMERQLMKTFGVFLNPLHVLDYIRDKEFSQKFNNITIYEFEELDFFKPELNKYLVD